MTGCQVRKLDETTWPDALAGVRREIARRGGGTVQSYPEDTEGRKPSSSFLHNGTAAMFESRDVPAADGSGPGE